MNFRTWGVLGYISFSFKGLLTNTLLIQGNQISNYVVIKSLMKYLSKVLFPWNLLELFRLLYFLHWESKKDPNPLPPMTLTSLLAAKKVRVHVIAPIGVSVIPIVASFILVTGEVEMIRRPTLL